jgi:hypothetical protein
MSTLEIENPKKKQKDQANTNKERGDSYIKTSCMMCKFKPNFEDAIPFYKSAADEYHAQNNFKEEIYCREKLVVCFRSLTSEWEEGNEYNKIANVQVINLQDYSGAVQTIQNAHNSFFIKGEYKFAIDSVTKLANKLMEINEITYAEKCLKIAFESVLTVFHSIASKPDEPTDFLYKAIEKYMALNFKLNKIDNVIESAEKLIKVIEPYEADKELVANIYGYYLLGLMIKDNKELFNDTAAKGKASADYKEYAIINNFENIYDNLVSQNETMFKRNVRDLSYDHEVHKYLLNLFQIRKGQTSLHEAKVNANDIEIKVVDDLDDYR